MEPSKEAISVRLARLNNLMFDKSFVTNGSTKVSGRLLNKDGLLDALVVLYDECNNNVMKRSDEHIAKFVEKYRVVLSEIKRLRVNMSDFEVKDIIGRGYFGEVHVVREKHTGDVFAMKTLRKETTLKHKATTFYKEEKDIMALSKSEWLIKLHYAFQDSAQLYLVMEFCPGGDLAGLLDRRGQPLLENEACFYVAELSQALNALHTMGYVHRDIKPDNVLLDRCGHLKLADFGSAAKISSTGKVTAVMPVGTPDYIAPELLKAMESSKLANHGPPCDFWSLGIVAYELVTLKTPFSDQNDRVIQTYGNIMKSKGILYSPEVENSVSSDYKELIRCLLNSSPELRYGYLDVFRHPALKNIHWTALRNEVPPFVPMVNSLYDTSNFVEFEKHLPKPSLGNFLNRNQFSGRNLPFIGFTYTEEADPLNNSKSCCSSGVGGGDSFVTAAEDLNSSIDSHDHSTVNGFMNSSYNSTAINMKSVKELERALETRTREAVNLKKRLSEVETGAKVTAKRAEKVPSLEHDLAHALAAVSRLTRQIDQEHKDRADLENKSLELISLAKKRWEAKSLAQNEQANKAILEYEFKVKELDCEKEILMNKVNNLTVDLEKANKEIMSLKSLQSNYKDSMAKARLVSRQSTVVSETQNAALSSAAAREIAASEDRARRLVKELRAADDRQKSLLIELNESKKDYADLRKEILELSSVQEKVKRLEEENLKLLDELEKRYSSKISSLSQNILNEKGESAKLRSQIRKLQTELCETKRTYDVRKSDESDKAEQSAMKLARFEEMLQATERKNSMLQKKLDNTLNSEERHKDKVTELENLVQKLEQEVSRLEGCSTPLPTNKEVANAAKVSLLEDQLLKIEEQLAKSREQHILVKEESKRNATALWKKEKELSDCDLDKRIAQRELKQIETKVNKLTEQLRSSADEKAKLQETIELKDNTIETLKREVEDSIETLDKAEDSIRDMQNACERKEEALASCKDDLSKLRNEIVNLRTELQYCESRKSKAELTVDELRLQLKNVEEIKSCSREENIKLVMTLEEKIRELETLQMNHKMLQDACNVLEDQLVDFEKIVDAQEARNKDLKSELSTTRASSDAAMMKVSEAEKLAGKLKAERDMLNVKLQRAKADNDHYCHRANQLEKELKNMHVVASEAESRVIMLEENSSLASSDSTAKVKALREELRNIKEEYSSTATNLYESREHAACLSETVRQLKEELSACRRTVAANEAEALALAEHFRQRELRAQETITQHTKLIDFLQAKVEESTRRKRSGLGNLFRSGGREAPLTGSPIPTANNSATERSLHRERQKNRELRDQISLLKHKITALESTVTDGKGLSKYGDSSYDNEKLPVQDNRTKTNSMDKLDGWVRILKGDITERMYMTLSECHLRWYSDLPSAACSKVVCELQLTADAHPTQDTSDSNSRLCPIRLTTRLTADNAPALSETERSFAFMLEWPGMVLSWPSRQLVVVCPSELSRERWLRALSSFVVVVEESTLQNANSDTYTPRSFITIHRRKVVPRCVIEIKNDIYLIGAEQGLFSYHTPVNTLNKSKSEFNGPDELVKIMGMENILDMKVVNHVNMLLSLCSPSSGSNATPNSNLSLPTAGHLWLCDLRLVKSAAESSASLQPSVKARHISLPNNELCRKFDVIINNGECTVCACVTGAIVILVEDLSRCEAALLPKKRIEMVASVTASALMLRSLLVAAGPSIYRLDLQRCRMESFLEQQVANQYLERNVIDIVCIKMQRKEHSEEYLICYKECGIFVDECGKRSRSEDLKWTTLPTCIIYRQPFLYIFYYNSVHILGIDDRVCQLPACECNCDTSSLSTISTVQEKIVIDMPSPKYMGKSTSNAGIIVSSMKGQSITLVEIIGSECFRRGLGISMETLDTVSVDGNGVDSDWIDEVDGCVEIEGTSDTSHSSCDGNDFRSTIRKRALLLKSKRENEIATKSDTVSSGSSGQNKSSAELCAEIFASERKTVRFGEKYT